MSAPDTFEVAIDKLRAFTCPAGVNWAVVCEVSECNARIVGYIGRDVALRAALHHLIWHVNGKPTCRDCGAWLGHKTSKRCRKGTCEADR